MCVLGDEELKRGRGRPRKEGSKYVQLNIRMTEEEFEKLTNTSTLVGKTKSEIVRDGIVMSMNNELYRYNLSKEQEEIENESYDFDEFEDYGDDFYGDE